MSARLYSPSAMGIGPASLRAAALGLAGCAHQRCVHSSASLPALDNTRAVPLSSFLKSFGRSGIHTNICTAEFTQNTRHHHSGDKSSAGRVWKSAPVSIAMGLAAFGLFDKEKGEVQCDSPPIPTSRPPTPAAGGPPPPSANKEPLLNVANLSFGTIAGLCSGVFVKKGLKLLAVLLGAAFILLQYLSTQHLISVNWSGIASRYEKAADRAAQQTGNQNAPTSWRDSRLAKIWGRFINFLTTGFQWKASFIAGFGVGFRYG